MTKPSHIKLRHIVPSALTAFAICAGMTSIRMSLEGHVELALYFILLAVFLDAADGKLARYLDTASPFGAELDTLADFFNFGIVPGVLLYNTLYIGTAYSSLGFLATLVLAVCCALRLARFNLSMKSEEASPKRDDLFVGVPAPALACLALMPIFHYAVTRPTDIWFQPLNWAVVRRIGQWSFTIYLIHYVIIKSLIFNGIAAHNSLILIVLSAVLSIIFAAATYRWLEKPLHPLRRRLTGH